MGVLASYYNRYLDELGDHFLRKANETIQFVNCEISHNEEEAIYVHSPYWNVFHSNLSEISFHLNNRFVTTIMKNINKYKQKSFTKKLFIFSVL